MTIITNRRHLLAGAAGIAGGAFFTSSCAHISSPSFASGPFKLGVASGDPDAHSVVLWTRIAPDPMAAGYGAPVSAVPVGWELADDEGFSRIVMSGETLARPEEGHSVHVVADGLQSDRPYWYRFQSGGVTSPTGRTRTIPAVDASPQSLRYVFGACQRFENGYYSAWRDAAAENPDLIFFLGDYIYENGARDGLPRRHTDELPTDLPSYRRRYSLYRMDPDLQAAHAAAPWVMTWDDHEVINNYKATRSPGIEDTAALMVRRAAAYQAWYEHMPVRPRSTPVTADMKIYQSLNWGHLASFQVLDARQYATWTDWPVREGDKKLIADSDLRRDPSRSMLGLEQEGWLFDKLSRSDAQWNVLAQQFVMAELRRRDEKTGEFAFGSDGWDAFPASRKRVMQRLEGVSNPMIIGGDMHAFAKSDLAIDPGGDVIAPAFVGGSISSPNNRGNVRTQEMVRDNPEFAYSDGAHNGHGLVELTPKGAKITFRAVNDVTDPKSGSHDLAVFEMEPGRPGAEKI